MTRALRLLPIAGIALALLGMAVLGAGLMIERSLDDVGCDAIDDSMYGQAEWSWLPPGVTCTYPSPANPAYEIEESPPMARVGEIVLAVALVAVSARLFTVERRGRGE